MNAVSNGGAGGSWSMGLSLRKHTTFLHNPRCELYKYRRALAFLEEWGVRDGRKWRRVGKFGWRDVFFGGRGGRTGF